MGRIFFIENKRMRPGGLSLMAGLAAALAILTLVPLTQFFEAQREPAQPIEAVELAPPPPPPPPPEPPPPPPEPEDEPPPELQRPPPLPTLEQLEVSLNPGAGDLTIGRGLGMEVDFSTESAGDLEQLFGFSELDEIPRLTREGPFRYPTNAPRGRGEAFVRLLVIIDRGGRVSVERTVDFSHREFVEPARRMAESSRFSTPTRNGEPVRSRYEWPIRIPFR